MNFIEDIVADWIGDNGPSSNPVFRFPPEPNGYLHLGHAKAICLNFGLAEKYKTTCNLRYDDTNPLAEDSLFVEGIKEDIEWLGFEPTNTLWASDYFEMLIEKAKLLIKKELAYMDDSTSEEIATLKGDLEHPGSNSPFRDRSIEENLKLFQDLLDGNSGSVLRAKIDMSHPNLLMRDPVIYRRVNAVHHNTGDKYKAYPMYDFAHPLSDWYEGITHSLCTLEFVDHRPFYNWVLENTCEGSLPRQIEFSRLNVEGIRLSKRYLKELVDDGTVTGWDDPRMPTIKGLKRRGYTPSSIRTFCDKIGITKRDSVIERSLLEECLRDELNKNSLRRMVVKDPIKLTIITPFAEGTATLENNPEDPNDGTRTVNYSEQFWIEREDFRIDDNKNYNRLKLGGNVRLKGVCIVKAVDYLEVGGEIMEVFCEHYPDSFSGMETDVKAKGTIHWVNRMDCEQLTLNHFEDMQMEKLIAFGEPLLKLEYNYPVQFVRHGYYIKDGDNWNHTVSLKNSFKG